MHILSIHCRILICCTCHFQSGFPFVYFGSSVCKSLRHLICTLTQGGEGSPLFRLTCSVVLWGRRDIAKKYCWHVWGVLTMEGPHTGFATAQGSTPLRFQGALQGYCPRWTLHFMPFSDLSCSGFWVLHSGKDRMGCAFCALPRS